MTYLAIFALVLNTLLLVIGSKAFTWRTILGILLHVGLTLTFPVFVFPLLTFIMIYAMVSETPESCMDRGTSVLYHGILGIQILANFAALISVWS